MASILAAASLAGAVCPPAAAALLDRQTAAALLVGAKLLGAGVILATALAHMLVPALLALAACPAASPAPDRSHDDDDIDIDDDQDDIQVIDRILPVVVEEPGRGAHACSAHAEAVVSAATPASDLMQRLATVMLLAGIVAHSLLVGISLGAADSQLDARVAGMSLHQFLEAAALVAIFHETKFVYPNTAMMLAAIYVGAMPLGILIGSVMQQALASDPTQTLLVQSTLDLVASGILLYDALVHIVASHFSTPAFTAATPEGQIAQIAVMWCGAAVIALLA
nr:hypothetical protein HK105_000108 [Polyrhizophydium stewartii]